SNLLREEENDILKRRVAELEAQAQYCHQTETMKICDTEMCRKGSDLQQYLVRIDSDAGRVCCRQEK
ncbi:hypothetical protein MKW98_029668, partial [Papaver atlanticum]